MCFFYALGYHKSRCMAVWLYELTNMHIFCSPSSVWDVLCLQLHIIVYFKCEAVADAFTGGEGKKKHFSAGLL